jgi:hypothetical protein
MNYRRTIVDILLILVSMLVFTVSHIDAQQTDGNNPDGSSDAVTAKAVSATPTRLPCIPMDPFWVPHVPVTMTAALIMMVAVTATAGEANSERPSCMEVLPRIASRLAQFSA